MSHSTYVRNKDFYNFCYYGIVIILTVIFFTLNMDSLTFAHLPLRPSSNDAVIKKVP